MSILIRTQNRPNRISYIRHSFLMEKHFRIILFMIFFVYYYIKLIFHDKKYHEKELLYKIRGNKKNLRLLLWANLI